MAFGKTNTILRTGFKPKQRHSSHFLEYKLENPTLIKGYRTFVQTNQTNQTILGNWTFWKLNSKEHSIFPEIPDKNGRS
jgi:hypothetical protein